MLSGKVALTDMHKGQISARGNTLMSKGSLAGYVYGKGSNAGKKDIQYDIALDYEAQVRVLNEGGTLAVSPVNETLPAGSASVSDAALQPAARRKVILSTNVAETSLTVPGVRAVIDPGWYFRLTTVITLVGGTMFLMWLGEQITERGIGNGISMIILAGIVAGVPGAIAGTAQLVRNGEMSAAVAIIMLAVGIAAIIFVVYMERAQRRITVNYARRQQGRKMYAAQSTHLPFKINMSGVIPPIFASSILMFPATIAQFLGLGFRCQGI